MPIHISNSNGSCTIIFHIIQTFMLTHQLACINISYSNTHFKPFNSSNNSFVLHTSFMLLMSNNCKQAISHGPFWSNKQSELFLTVPNRAVGCQWATPSSSIGSTFVGPKPMALPDLTILQHHFHDILNKNNKVGEDPYLPEFVETPQNWYPRVALTM